MNSRRGERNATPVCWKRETGAIHLRWSGAWAVAVNVVDVAWRGWRLIDGEWWGNHPAGTAALVNDPAALIASSGK